MQNNTKVLKRAMDLAKSLEHWKYRRTEYTNTITSLNERITRTGAKPAPRYISDIKERLPPVPGCLITREHVKEYISCNSFMTFYDKELNPRTVKGVMTDASLRYVRIESLSGRSWYVQYNRMIAVSFFHGKKLLRIIHDDLTEGW